MKSMLPDQ
jgi:hypothetical protein